MRSMNEKSPKADAPDMVEVIRCIDCRKSRPMAHYGYCYCERYKVVRKHDDYCSRAKVEVDEQ